MADAFDAAWDISKEDEMVSIKVPKSMIPMIEMMMSDPEVYMDHGDEGGLPYNVMSLKRPDMEGLYEPFEEYADLPPDYLGDYHGDDGSMRGHLQKVKLMELLRGMMG